RLSVRHVGRMRKPLHHSGRNIDRVTPAPKRLVWRRAPRPSRNGEAERPGGNEPDSEIQAPCRSENRELRTESQRVTPHVTSGYATPPLLSKSDSFAEERLRLSSVRIITASSCLIFGVAAWRINSHGSS